MRLNELHSSDDEMDLSPNEMREYEIDGLRPDLTPLDPEWVPTIYYNPDRFPNDASIERFERYYENEFPGRPFSRRSLPSASLLDFAIAKYPIVEELFRRRGFVSDIEVTSFQKKDHHPETTYLAINKAATYLQLAAIGHVLSCPGKDAKAKSDPSAHLARLIDGHRLRRGKTVARIPAPLVERDGVFQVGDRLREKEEIHFAHGWSASLAIDHGRRDPFGLCHAMPEEIAAQIKFECDNSTKLFNGAHVDALLLWQSQALAVLRKVVWEIELTTGVAFSRQQTAEAKTRAIALKTFTSDGAKSSVDQITSAFDAALGDCQDAYQQAMIEENGKSHTYGPALGTEKYNHGITTEQNVTAALHGSTYQPDYGSNDNYDRSHPLHWLKPVAEWIGQLKRHRHGVLTAQIAECLAAIFGESDVYADHDARLQEAASVVEDRLGEIAWSVIADAIPEILNGSATSVSVVYDWTRKAEEPWAAERRDDGTIVIRGPLLDFPVSRALYWNEQASLIAQEAEAA